MSHFSEEAGESAHRRHKMNRLHGSRKVSPEANLEDMFVAALSWSDPFVAESVSKRSHKRRTKSEDIDFNRKLELFYR